MQNKLPMMPLKRNTAFMHNQNCCILHIAGRAFRKRASFKQLAALSEPAKIARLPPHLARKSSRLAGKRACTTAANSCAAVLSIRAGAITISRVVGSPFVMHVSRLCSIATWHTWAALTPTCSGISVSSRATSKKQ